MESLETTYGHLQLEYQRVILHGLVSVHVMLSVTKLSQHLWGKITFASQDTMHHGMVRDTMLSTPTTLYGMERTVSPAAHVAHNVILHILSSNCRTQPLMTLRPGSVWMMYLSMRTLQWSYSNSTSSKETGYDLVNVIRV